MQQKPIRIKWDQGDRQDETLILNQQVKWYIQRCHDSSIELLKDQGVGSGPNPGNLHPFESSSHSLAYEITQPIKTNHTKFRGGIVLCQGPHSVKCVSLCIWINSLLTYHFVSHWILSTMRHQELEFQKVSKPGIEGFGWIWVPGHGFKSQAGF